MAKREEKDGVSLNPLVSDAKVSVDVQIISSLAPKWTELELWSLIEVLHAHLGKRLAERL